jgi:biopolymer transport protein ExbD
VVNVTASRKLLVRGYALTPAELESQLKQAVEKDGQDLDVRIRSDRQVPYEVVEPIMLSCARAGIWNVTFAVFREKGAL